MSSLVPNERIVNMSIESSNMRDQRNDISLATAVATTAAVTPERAMQSVQNAFIGIVAELREANMDNERLRAELQEAQKIIMAREKSFWAIDAENHAIQAQIEDLTAKMAAQEAAHNNEVNDLKTTNDRLTNAHKKEMMKKDKKIKAKDKKIKTLDLRVTLMLAREGGRECRLRASSVPGRVWRHATIRHVYVLRQYVWYVCDDG